MKATVKQIRLDLQRFSGAGRAWVAALIFMSVPVIGILLNTVMALTGNDGDDARGVLTTMVVGMEVGMIFGLALSLFAEFSNTAIRLNGLLPITRDHQVFGRYAAVSLLSLVYSCGCSIFFFSALLIRICRVRTIGATPFCLPWGCSCWGPCFLQ